MRLRTPVCVLAAATLLAAGLATAATATTVVVYPGGNESGTFFSSKFAFTTSAKNLTCVYLDTVATVTGGFTSISTNYWLAFQNSCTLTGGAGVTFSCLANARWTVTGLTSGGATPGRISGLSCTSTVTGSSCSVRISGSVDVSFDNTFSRLTVSPTAQTLVASGSTCAPLPNDINVRFTDTSGFGAAIYLSPTMTLTVT
jgi:hypothetical protein